MSRVFRVVAAVVVSACVALAGCSSSGSGPAPKVTAPHFQNSPPAAQLIADLYAGEHGSYWRKQKQEVVLLDAALNCVPAKPGVTQDLRSSFPDLPDGADAEFSKLAKTDMCAAIDANNGKIPGYSS
jgi:hypothetical protein